MALASEMFYVRYNDDGTIAESKPVKRGKPPKGWVRCVVGPDGSLVKTEEKAQRAKINITSRVLVPNDAENAGNADNWETVGK